MTDPLLAIVSPVFTVNGELAGSLARDCVRLDLDLPALRTDVDDDQALRRAVAIGVGRHTAAVLHLTLD